MDPNKYNVHGIRVRLSSSMIGEAEEAAIQRQKEAIDNGRELGRQATPEEQLQTKREATRAECAGKFWFDPCKWNKYHPGIYTSLPDLELPCGIRIDVKRIRSDRHHLIVPKATDLQPHLKVRPDWYYVLISIEHHPVYWLMGWLRGDEVLKCKVEKEFDRNAYKADKIHDIYLLNRIIENNNGRGVPF